MQEQSRARDQTFQDAISDRANGIEKDVNKSSEINKKMGNEI